MSTTVSYKGETLATLTNATKTLNTAGTWVEGDITVTDSTAGINLQSKTGIAPSTASQTVSADAGYDGLSTVQINAMPAGSVTVPSTISGSGSTIGTAYTANGYKIYLDKTLSVTPSVTTSGYVSNGTAGNTDIELVANLNLVYGYNSGITFKPSTTSETLLSNSYIKNTSTIEAVTLSNLTSENIKNGVTVKVGCASDDDSVTSVTGTYAPALQAKTNIAPSTASKTISPDDGYDGLSSVQINAMPAGSVTSPSTITGTGATLTTGTNTLTLAKTISVTPNVTTSGYVSSGTAGNANVSLTATVTTTGTQTLYPSTADQTVTSGRYLTGTQTFKGVTTSNISASNIKSGVTIKVGDSADDDRILSVTGTYEGGSSGYDLPMFTIHFDSNYDLDSVTCDKTYSECYNSLVDDYGWALCQLDWDGWIEDNKEGASGYYNGLDNNIIYNVAHHEYPYCEYVITYYSNGTLDAVVKGTQSDLTVSGANVTASAGYYPNSVTQSVATGTVTAPSTISGTGATLTASAGLLGGSPTLTLSTNAVSVTPVVTTSGYVTTGTHTFPSIALTANIGKVYNAVNGIISPSSSDISIPSATYFSTNYTIPAVTVLNLIASNIKSGVTVEVGTSNDTDYIASVTGTYTGGATNYVEGTFTPGTTAGWVDLTIPYTGSSYPVALTIVVDGGCYDTTITAWYDLVSRYAIGMFNMTKADFDTAPTYATSSSTTTNTVGNRGVVMSTYKNSTSSATTYTRAGAMTAASYCSSMTATVGAGSAAMFKSNKIIRYYAQGSGTSYGFAKNVTYRYMVTYYQ